MTPREISSGTPNSTAVRIAIGRISSVSAWSFSNGVIDSRVGHRPVGLQSDDLAATPVPGELDVLLRHPSVLDQVAAQIPHGRVLPGEPGERPTVPPSAIPDRVPEQGGRARLGAVAHQPGHLDVRQTPQLQPVRVLSDLDEHPRPRAVGQLLEQAGDRGIAVSSPTTRSQSASLRERPRCARAIDADAVADLGTVGPGGAHADAVLDEVARPVRRRSGSQRRTV